MIMKQIWCHIRFLKILLSKSNAICRQMRQLCFLNCVSYAYDSLQGAQAVLKVLAKTEIVSIWQKLIGGSRKFKIFISLSYCFNLPKFASFLKVNIEAN